MNIFQSFDGVVDIEMTCADVSETLRDISLNQIILENIQLQTALTVHFQIARRDIRKLKRICFKRGDKIRVIDRKGIYWSIKRMLHRPVLIFGIFFIFMLSLWLPTRVLFIQVSGNKNVPSDVILDYAAENGVYFGASTRDIRSERVKNVLTEQIPELTWVGVNTSGCVATIYVQDAVREEQSTIVTGTFDICASRDAFVTYIHATKGTICCKIGQAVTAGQTLIAANVPIGESILHTGTAGEVFGDTMRQLQCVTLNEIETRGQIIATEKKISLIIGKKQINLYIGSGICCSSCVKIINEEPLTLPGGFSLPIVMRTEYIKHYETITSDLSEDSFDWVDNCCIEYIKQQMIAGQILTADFTEDIADDLYSLKCEFTCNEMIGTITNEGITHGENH